MKICHTCRFEETTSKEKNSIWGAATLFVSWPTFLFHSLELESLGFHMLSKHLDWLKVCRNFDKIWIFHMASQYNFCKRGNSANFWTWGKKGGGNGGLFLCYNLLLNSKCFLYLINIGRWSFSVDFFIVTISPQIFQRTSKNVFTFVWEGLLTN